MDIIRPIPVAEQVNEILRERMREGIYRPGARLPSESDLSKEFGVSRATVRTVLARLEAEGLILRKQGDGTYINEHIQDVNTHLGGLWEFSRLIESSGYRPSIKPLQIVTRPASEAEAKDLDIKPGDLVLSMSRLFYANDKPVILAVNAIPHQFVDESSGAIDGQLQIREFLQRYCHRRLAYSISDVSAVRVHGEHARLLNCTPGDAMLAIHIMFYDRDNQPLVSGNSYYNDSVLSLRLVQAWG
jgi:GntR family transcriptional regulator